MTEGKEKPKSFAAILDDAIFNKPLVLNLTMRDDEMLLTEMREYFDAWVMVHGRPPDFIKLRLGQVVHYLRALKDPLQAKQGAAGPQPPEEPKGNLRFCDVQIYIDNG